MLRRSAVSLSLGTVLVLCHPLSSHADDPHPPSRRELPRPSSPLPSPTDQSPEARLQRGKLAYQRGDYAAAVLTLRPLLYPQTLLAQEDQLLLAHRLLALSYFFEHDEAGAEQEFNLLLSLRPDFSLDPLVDPLKAVAFLDDIRRRNEQRLEEVRRRQQEEELRQKAEAEALQKRAEELAQKQAKRVYYERVVHRKLSPLHFVPFGVPQLSDGRTAVGTVFLVGEALTGAASAGAWLTVRLRYPDNTFPAKEYQAAQALTGTYLGTGSAFWVLVLAGLIDALWHAKTTVEIRELSQPPKELLPPPNSTPQSTSAITPALSLAF